MFRRALVLTLLLLVLPSLAAEEAGPPKAFVKKYRTVSRKIVTRYLKVAKDANALNLFGLAATTMDKVLSFDPDQRAARKHLGYVKKGREWVLEPGKGPRFGRRDPPDRFLGPKSIREKVDKVRERAAEADHRTAAELQALAEWCVTKEFFREARATFERVVMFDKSNEAAWTALGYRREDGEWVLRGPPVGLTLEEANRITATFKRETAHLRRLCGYGPDHTVPVGKPLKLGGLTLTASRVENEVRIRIGTGEEAKEASFVPGEQEGVSVTGAGVTTWIFADDLGRLFHLNPSVLAGEIDGRAYHLHDADYDGKYFEPGEDWVADAAANHAVTWAEGIVLSDRRFLSVSLDEKAPAAVFRTERVGLNLSFDDRGVFRLMNEVRLHYGLHPADLDDRLSGWCRLHNRYLKQNQATGHEEDPTKPGYTANGLKAGHNGSLSYMESGARAFFDLLDTPLHGYELSAPMFTKTGLSFMPGYLNIWQNERDGLKWPERDDRLPAVFPPNLATGIPVDWGSENPDLRDKARKSDRWGYPIRLYIDPDGPCYPKYPEGVTATLTARSGGERVPLQIVSDPSNSGPFRHFVPFLALPRQALRPNMPYHFHVEWRYDGRDFAWDSTFTTGRAQGQRRTRLK